MATAAAAAAAGLGCIPTAPHTYNAPAIEGKVMRLKHPNLPTKAGPQMGGQRGALSGRWARIGGAPRCTSTL